MSLSIGTNNGAMYAAAAANSSQRSMEISMERLSTGKRINSSSDDAAGVAIASRLSVEIRGANQSIRNALDGQALLDTAEGAHKEVENILQRMREVAVQAANDTNNAQDRGNLQAELDALYSEIDRIAGTTTWAGANLMNDSTGSQFSFQLGSATGPSNQISVTIDSMNTVGLLLNSGPDGIDAVAAAGVQAAQDAYTLDKNAIGGTGAATFSDATTMGKQATGTLTLTKDGVVLASVATDNNESTIVSAPAITAAFEDYGVTAVSASAGFELEFTFSEVAAVAETPAVEEVIGVDPNTNRISVEATTGQDNASENALATIKVIDAAIKEVNSQRSELGAVSNRLNHTVNNLTNISSNLTAAKGGIEDTDFAVETTNLAKHQILQQASTAMLAQANASKQNVLALLRS